MVITLALAACGGSNDGASRAEGAQTAVTVSFFGAAAGAVGTNPPANLARIEVVALSNQGARLAGPAVADAQSGWVATLTVPNGRGIVFRARGFDAAGKPIYEGRSAPQDLIGLPVNVSITLAMVVAVQGPASVNRGQVVALTGTVAGSPPPATSALSWGATGGVVQPVAGTNGGKVNWTAPAVPGVFDVYAWVANNPDQPPGIRGTLRIQVINRNPYAAPDTARVRTGQAVVIDVLANDSDPDGDALTLKAVTNPANGQASIVAGKVRYVPQPGFAGKDQFAYIVVDPYGGKATGSVIVNVVANRPPAFALADPYGFSVNEDTYANFVATATDPDGDPLVYDLYTAPANGTAVVDRYTGAISYKGHLNYFGPDAFVVRVQDPYGAFALLHLNVTVRPVNDPPAFASASTKAWVKEDASSGISVPATDPDGDPIVYDIYAQPAHGTATITDIYAGWVSYRGARNFNGSDHFVVRARDPYGAAALLDVYVTVQPVNDPPVAGAPWDPYALSFDGINDFVDIGTPLAIKNLANILQSSSGQSRQERFRCMQKAPPETLAMSQARAGLRLHPRMESCGPHSERRMQVLAWRLARTGSR